MDTPPQQSRARQTCLTPDAPRGQNRPPPSLPDLGLVAPPDLPDPGRAITGKAAHTGPVTPHPHRHQQNRLPSGLPDPGTPQQTKPPTPGLTDPGAPRGQSRPRRAGFPQTRITDKTTHRRAFLTPDWSHRPTCLLPPAPRGQTAHAGPAPLRRASRTNCPRRACSPQTHRADKAAHAAALAALALVITNKTTLSPSLALAITNKTTLSPFPARATRTKPPILPGPFPRPAPPRTEPRASAFAPLPAGKKHPGERLAFPRMFADQRSPYISTPANPVSSRSKNISRQ